MLNPKIKMTDDLLRHIQRERMSRDIKAGELSLKLGKGHAFISALENGRIKTISATSLIQIFQAFEDISEVEAIDKIESIIGTQNDENKNKENEDPGNIDFDIPEDFDLEIIEGILKEVDRCFISLYKTHPKALIVFLNVFLQSLRSAPKIVLVLMSLPSFKLKPFTQKEHKMFVSDLYEIYQKYIKIVEDKQD